MVTEWYSYLNVSVQVVINYYVLDNTNRYALVLMDFNSNA
jgi:hypothetical protein